MLLLLPPHRPIKFIKPAPIRVAIKLVTPIINAINSINVQTQTISLAITTATVIATATTHNLTCSHSSNPIPTDPTNPNFTGPLPCRVATRLAVKQISKTQTTK